MEEIYQVITKFLDGKHKTLNFTTPTIPILSIKARIQELTAIPIADQLLLSNGKPLDNTQLLARSDITHHFPTVHLLLRLRGGKGGFGSLLRGAATKAGQKKTNNFDACRDMSGRRLRHVNTEKKLEEWNAEKKDRELEKIAEDYIKKRVKMAKKSGQGGDGGAEKYVEKYRKDSAKCMEEVDKSVRESLVNAFKSKRKSVVEEGEKSKSKKLKIWMGKRKVDESDSDEEDDDSDDAMVEETEKSVVINNENPSDSNKEADGSSASVTGGKLDGGSSVGCSSESGSEEEKETIPDGGSRSVQDSDCGSLNDEKDDPSKPVLELHEESIVQNKDSDVAAKCGNEAIPAKLDQSNKMEVGTVEEAICQASVVDIVQETGVSTTDIKPVVDAETVAASSDGPDLEKPLSFDDFNSATEMEVLGMERLKSELQASGLKCGGTLQERAARLFLLKTIPLEKLPKKLLAKK